MTDEQIIRYYEKRGRELDRRKERRRMDPEFRARWNAQSLAAQKRRRQRLKEMRQTDAR